MSSLYITPAEREKGEAIENCTKNEIKQEMLQLINSLPEQEIHDGLQELRNRILTIKPSAIKADYTQLYYDVQDATSELLLRIEGDDGLGEVEIDGEEQ